VENILRITGYVINTHEQRNASAGLLEILALAILNFSFGHSPQIQRARYADYWHLLFTSISFLKLTQKKYQIPNMRNTESVSFVLKSSKSKPLKI
jgi:hypothetical protein